MGWASRANVTPRGVVKQAKPKPHFKRQSAAKAWTTFSERLAQTKKT